MKLPNHGDMVANIIAYRRSATDEQVVAGKRWYGQARQLVELIADQTGIDAERVCYAVAALSPRNPWRWNVFDAYAFAAARAEGRTMPKATTFKRNQLAAWRALDLGQDPWKGSALKVRSFVQCIFGDSFAVVVDTWAVRVATNGSVGRIANDGQYLAVAAAYRNAAVLLGEEPSTLQAITWIVVRTEGTAVHQGYKSGTPDFLREAMDG